jgi:hypothetical protein
MEDALLISGPKNGPFQVYGPFKELVYQLHYSA